MQLPEGWFEFDLVVRKKGYKFTEFEERFNRTTENKEPEVLEELKFNILSAVEVMRRLLDYIRE